MGGQWAILMSALTQILNFQVGRFISGVIVIQHYPTREEQAETKVWCSKESQAIVKRPGRNRECGEGRRRRQTVVSVKHFLCTQHVWRVICYLLYLHLNFLPEISSLFLHTGLLRLRDMCSWEGLSEDSTWALSQEKQTLSQHPSSHFFIKHTHSLSLGRSRGLEESVVLTVLPIFLAGSLQQSSCPTHTRFWVPHPGQGEK